MVKIQHIKKHLFILTPIIAILLQGSYFNYQSYILAILLSITILLNLNKKCYIEKTSLLCFFIMVLGYTSSDLLNRNYNFVFEIIRFSCLVLPILFSFEDVKRKLLLGIYSSCTVLSLLGILAYAKVLPVPEWAANVDGTFRLQSIIGYANTTAVFCGIGILLGLHFRNKNENLKFMNSIMIFLNSIAFILTFSKLGLFCFIAAALLALSIRYKWVRYTSVTFLVIGLIGVSALFLLGREQILLGSSFVSRLIYWQDAFSLFMKNPFGIGAYAWEQKQYQIQSAGYYVKYVHNGFLQIALDGGIIALIGFCAIVIFGLKGIIRKYKNTKDTLYLILIAMIAFIILHGLVDIDFSYTAILLVLGIALSYGYEGKETEKKKPIAILITIFIITITLVQFVPMNTWKTIETIIQNYQTAYANNDYENMYQYAQEWVAFAPRQQNANDAYYVALSKLYETTGDINYKNDLNELRDKVNTLNKTVNPLTKYYDSYRNIFLPK